MESQAPSPSSLPSSSLPSVDFEKVAPAGDHSSPSSKAESVESVSQHELPNLPSSAADSQDQIAENERHPKGKRKRTAAKDKAILEAAYNANPKPDKAARLEIVNRVSLNEKEVQIWFQNRRQNDRRKSRPLSPQEIAALRYGGMQILSSDSPAYSPPNPAGSDAPSPVPVAPVVESPQSSSSLPSSQTPACASQLPIPVVADGEANSQGSDAEEMGQSETKATPVSSAHTTSPQAVDGADSSHLSYSFSSSVGYLANRWNPGSSFSTPSFSHRKAESFPPSSCSSAASAPILPPPKPASHVRLSLSLDGKAELIDSLHSPSPPRNPPALIFQAGVSAIPPIPPLNRRRSFQRSHSALPGITLPPISALTGPLSPFASSAGAQPPALPPRLFRGRSRNVHAWESCADSPTEVLQEDELTAQARNESSGSAVAAISLLRTTSALSALATGSALLANPSKRNTSGRGAGAGGRGARKRPKLGRASSSSMVRLHSGSSALSDKKQQQQQQAQTPVVLHQIATGPFDPKDPKAAKVSMLVSPGGNDSDKENWSPDEDGVPLAVSRAASSREVAAGQHQHPRRRPLPSGAPAKAQGTWRRVPARVLGEQRGRPSLAAGGRSNTAPVVLHQTSRRKRGMGTQLEIFEDRSDDDDENEDQEGRPPHGRTPDEVERFMRGEVSPGKKGDLDCVAGLLSLSQGNWR